MNTVMLYFQLFLAFCNSCVMIAMFIKVLGRPHNTLDKRITTLEVKVSEVEESSGWETITSAPWMRSLKYLWNVCWPSLILK